MLSMVGRGDADLSSFDMMLTRERLNTGLAIIGPMKLTRLTVFYRKELFKTEVRNEWRSQDLVRGGGASTNSKLVIEGECVILSLCFH